MKCSLGPKVYKISSRRYAYTVLLKCPGHSAAKVHHERKVINLMIFLLSHLKSQVGQIVLHPTLVQIG